MKQKNISKLFGVLVLGGAMMANGSDKPVDPDPISPAPACALKIVETAEFFNPVDPSNPDVLVNETCIDGKSDEEILKIVKEAREPSCMSPFCNCWLG